MSVRELLSSVNHCQSHLYHFRQSQKSLLSVKSAESFESHAGALFWRMKGDEFLVEIF